jgi:hypothetical protein
MDTLRIDGHTVKQPKIRYLALMSFPNEWLDWDMYPDELFEIQSSGYEQGHEDASEHDRHGAFQWWLKRNPSKDQLLKLTKLTFLDPDEDMGTYVRGFILRSVDCDDEIRQLIGDNWIDDD